MSNNSYSSSVAALTGLSSQVEYANARLLMPGVVTDENKSLNNNTVSGSSFSISPLWLAGGAAALYFFAR